MRYPKFNISLEEIEDEINRLEMEAEEKVHRVVVNSERKLPRCVSRFRDRAIRFYQQVCNKTPKRQPLDFEEREEKIKRCVAKFPKKDWLK